MNRNIAFCLAVRMETTTSDSTKKAPFYYPLIIGTDILLVGLRGKLNSHYSWSESDAVCLNYWEEIKKIFLPLTDDTIGVMFAQSASVRFGKIEIKVVQSSAAQPVEKARINRV